MPSQIISTASAPDTQNDVVPPSNFVCPLTCEVMTFPVMTKYGHTFEKSALTQWLNRGNDTCPLTRQPLSPSDIISHRSLEQQIIGWKKLHGLYSKPQEEEAVNALAMSMQQPVFMATGGDQLSRQLEQKIAKQARAVHLLQQMQLEHEAKESRASTSSSSHQQRKHKKSIFSKIVRRR